MVGPVFIGQLAKLKQWIWLRQVPTSAQTSEWARVSGSSRRLPSFPVTKSLIGYGCRSWRMKVWDGPSDNAMYVADPLFDKLPYGTTSLPPFDGARRAPLRPGPDRNFDNLDWNSRSFLAAHAYACVRFVLGIWQSYLGHPVRWFFEERYERLEIVPLADWQNAQAGYGFLELGYSLVAGVKRPYATELRHDSARDGPFRSGFPRSAGYLSAFRAKMTTSPSPRRFRTSYRLSPF